MTRFYQGTYKPYNVKKYKGNPDNVCYRSRWELLVFRWCDLNDDVVEWSSEETVIPYVCRTDKKVHRYFIDLYVKFKSGRKFLIEIKPESQTVEPKKTKGKRQTTYIMESLTYAKNISKWEAARAYAADRGMYFQVWGEQALKSIGVNVDLKGKKKIK